MNTAAENTLMRLMGDITKAEKKAADITKAIEVEKASLETMNTVGEKVIKKRQYFEDEIRNAFKRHHETVEKINIKFDSQDEKLEGKETSLINNKTEMEEELDGLIEATERKFAEKIEALEKERDRVLSDLQKRKEKVIAKEDKKTTPLEQERKRRNAKRELEIKEEERKFEKYKDYLQGQLDILDINNPVSKRLAVLKEQEKQAQEEVSELRSEYEATLLKMRKAELAKREAEENARKAEKMRLQMQEEHKKALEAEQRMESNRAYVAQWEKEKQFYAERDRKLAQMTAEEKAELEKAADLQREKDHEEALKRSQEKARAHDLALQKKYEQEMGVDEAAEASNDDTSNRIIEVSSHTTVRSVVKGKKRM